MVLRFPVSIVAYTISVYFCQVTLALGEWNEQTPLRFYQKWATLKSNYLFEKNYFEILRDIYVLTTIKLKNRECVNILTGNNLRGSIIKKIFQHSHAQKIS